MSDLSFWQRRSLASYGLRVFFLLFCPVVLLSFWMLPSEGFVTDQNAHWHLVEQMKTLGWAEFLDAHFNLSTFPVQLGFLKVLGLFTDSFGLAKSNVIIKSPAFLAHMLILLAATFFMWPKYKEGRISFPVAYGALLLLGVWPAQLHNALVFGQYDSIFNLFFFLYLYCLLKQKIVGAAICLSLALLSHVYAPLLLPVTLILISHSSLLKKAFSNRKLLFASTFVLSFLVCSIPFWWNRPVQFLNAFYNYFGSSQFVSMNGYNIYALLDLNFSRLSNFQLFSWHFLPLLSVMFLLMVFLLLLKSRSRESDDSDGWVASLIFLLSFVFFAPSGNERTGSILFPVFAIILIGKQRFPLLFLSLGLIFAINQDQAMDIYFGAKRAFHGPLIFFGPVLIFLSLIYLCLHWVFPNSRFLGSKDFGFFEVLGDARISLVPDITQRISAKYLWLVGFGFLVSLSMSFYHLGSMKMPQSGWHMQENAILEFDSSGQGITDVWLYSDSVDVNLKLECLQTQEVLDAKLDSSTFRSWHRRTFSKPCMGSQIKLSKDQISAINLIELNLWAKELFVPLNIVCSSSCQEAANHPLFDESKKELIDYSPYESAYFDEVYYARSAMELASGQRPYESTHPALGKVLTATLFKIFPHSPFLWRSLGAFFGALIPLWVFLLTYLISGNLSIAIISMFLGIFDLSRLALARICTIDIYVAFFILGTYACFVGSFRVFWNGLFLGGQKKAQLPTAAALFFLSALMLGLSLAVKWIGVFSYITLNAIYVCIVAAALYEKYRETGKVNSRFLYRGILGSVFFIFFPLFIYGLSFYPYTLFLHGGYSYKDFLQAQVDMWDYHSKLKAQHPFSSKFYSWPFLQMPVGLFSQTLQENPEWKRVIYVMGNPAIWWLSFPAFVGILFNSRLVVRPLYLMLLAFYACQFFPWVISGRITFMYHYLTSLLLSCSLISICLYEYFRGKKKMVGAYLITVLAMFTLFAPIVMGFVVSENFVSQYLRWFSNWYF